MMKLFPRLWKTIREHGKLTIGVLTAATLVAAFTFAHLIGIFALERHRGFFAPVWGADGHHVYLIERETLGIVWGPGWEFFSPPARSYVISDRLTLQRLNRKDGKLEVLERFEGSPVEGRVTRHYRGRIFNTMTARLLPDDHGVEFSIRMNVPRVPSSEQWALSGIWTPEQPSEARWDSTWAGNIAAPEEVLQDGIELITLRGREAFPAAILAVVTDGDYTVLLKNDDFHKLYADGVPPHQIAERSNRERIERARELRRVTAELTAKYRAQGLNEGAATLRAYDDMEEQGYLPKGPRMVATALNTLPPDLRVFEIPEEYFRVGLFQDIAAAISNPEQEVTTSTGTYLKYYDDELGVQLKAWREAGNDRFAVRAAGKLYLLEVRRFDQG